MSDTLKNCPFCGGNAIIVPPRNGTFYYDHDGYIDCTNCSARTESLIEWNNRATPNKENIP